MPFTETTGTPTTLVAIPPVLRTVLYYGLALGNAVVLGLASTHHVDAAIALVIANVSGVFGFTLASQNVTRPVVAQPLVAPPVAVEQLPFTE